MANDIKITMLGASGTGKTCFMVGMYAMMREGVRGFTFSTSDWDLDLKLDEDWERILNGEGENRWPPPTDNTPQYYSFNFNYGFAKLAGFQWMDYRGGALSDRSSAKDLQELKAHLRDSSAVFLCVSGEHLSSQAHGLSPSDKRRKAQITSMNRLLSELYAEVNEPPPAAIIITKHDLCRDRQKTELLEEIKELFNPLFVKNSGWLVMVCPVTLGKDLATDVENGAIAPRNIHLPVTFSVYCEFKNQAVKEKAAAESERMKLSAYNGGVIKEWWYRNARRRHTLEIEHKTETYRDVEAKMQLLASDLMVQTDIFFGGQEVKIDV